MPGVLLNRLAVLAGGHLSGSTVLETGHLVGMEIRIRKNAMPVQAQFGKPTPGAARMFPHHPNAVHAGWRLNRQLPMWSGQAMSLLGVADDGRRILLATLRAWSKRDPAAARPWLEQQPAPLFCSWLPLLLFTSAGAASRIGLDWYFHHLGFLEAARFVDPCPLVFRDQVFLPGQQYQRVLKTGELLTAPALFLVCRPFERLVRLWRGSDRTFRQWVEDLARQDPATWPPRCRPQAHPLLQQGWVKPTWVVRAEQVLSGLRMVERNLGLTAAPVTLYTGRPKARPKAEAGTWADRQVDPAQVLPGPAAFFDTALEQLALRLYADDFRHFGFACQLAAPKTEPR